VAALLAALLLCALLLGCGSSKRDPAPAVRASSGSTQHLSGASLRTLAKSTVASCRRAVARARSVPAEAKAELKFVCSKVVDRSGYLAPQLRQDVCNEVEHASTSSDASVREAARKECETEAAR
jgi:hypothetical protein